MGEARLLNYHKLEEQYYWVQFQML